MASSLTVRVVEDTRLEGLRALAGRFRPGVHSVLVGVPAGAPPKDGELSLAQVAMWNEFGTARIPERPFLRCLGERRLQRQIIWLNAQNLIAIAQGSMTEERALGILGSVAAGLVKGEISANHFAPNAPSTIAAKGSATPLVDSGQLRQSITWVLDEGQTGPGVIR